MEIKRLKAKNIKLAIKNHVDDIAKRLGLKRKRKFLFFKENYESYKKRILESVYANI